MAKKKFYGDAVTIGASAVSVHFPKVASTGYTVPETGVPVGLGHLRSGSLDTVDGSKIPDCEVARIASIIVPAGVHAIIDFADGRQFKCYCADKPVKVKPSMLAPAHAWRAASDITPLFKFIICDATGKALTGNAATTLQQYRGVADSFQVNVAVRSY